MKDKNEVIEALQAILNNQTQACDALERIADSLEELAKFASKQNMLDEMT